MQVALALLMVAALIATLAPRLRVPIEVLLLLGSLSLSFIPGLPQVELDPEVVFLLFLPPILFAAAYFTSWRDFKANVRPISLLAIGLVLFTSASVAAAVKWLVPSLSWATAFILGAMVSPPDASAATSITRKLGVPRRLITIIEGESLVNDATALVIYKFAIAAVLTGIFSPGLAVLKFLWVGIGGVGVGLAIGVFGLWLYQRMSQTAAQTLVSFLTAFAAYTVGEAAGVSGVISTVTSGLCFGRWLPTHATAELRIEAKAGWDFVLFIINAFVFTLIGFQLPMVLESLRGHGYTRLGLLGYASLISAVVVAVRFLWVFPAAYLPRWIFPSIAKRDPAPPASSLLILAWTGMRGIVTLAAALALPTHLEDRSLLIFLAYSVILVTLLVPSFTLPWLIRFLGIKADQDHLLEETNARIEAVQEVLKVMEEMRAKGGFHPQHLDQLEARYKRRAEILEANLKDTAFSPLFDEDAQMRRLLREVINHERRAIIRMRDNSSIHNEVFHQLTRELDLEDLRLRTQRL